MLQPDLSVTRSHLSLCDDHIYHFILRFLASELVVTVAVVLSSGDGRLAVYQSPTTTGNIPSVKRAFLRKGALLFPLSASPESLAQNTARDRSSIDMSRDPLDGRVYSVTLHTLLTTKTSALFIKSVVFLKYILLIMLLQLSHFFPLYSPLPHTLLPPAFPHLSSCLWVIHISCLASPFPILFLPSPCLICTYHLCYLFPVPFPPFSPIPFPTNIPPCDLHFRDSVPVLVIHLVCFWFWFF